MMMTRTKPSQPPRRHPSRRPASRRHLPCLSSELQLPRNRLGDIQKKRTQLLAMDTSVPRSMKSAAKCDNSREPQSPVTRRIFERTMRRGFLPRRVCLSVANEPLRREVDHASLRFYPTGVELGVPWSPTPDLLKCEKRRELATGSASPFPQETS